MGKAFESIKAGSTEAIAHVKDGADGRTKWLSWKNADHYPDPKTTSLDRWAFEFLWRNDEFRRQFDVAAKEQAELRSAGHLPAAWNQMPTGKVLKKWGVDRPILPEWIADGLSDSPARFEVFPQHMHLATINGIDVRIAAANPSRVTLEFDLTTPLPPQIERASRILKLSQKSYEGPKRTQGKNSTRLFPIYLRVLDMLVAKLSRARMLEVLSADDPDGVGEDDVRNWINAAEALRDGGYRKITQNAVT